MTHSTMTQDDLVERLRRVHPPANAVVRPNGPYPSEPMSFTMSVSNAPVSVNPDGPEAADRIQSLTAENSALREAIRTARARFYEYADSHKAKGTTEGDVKAARNLEMAEMLSASLQPKESDR